MQCSDPHISIADNAGYFGSLAIDSTKENISDYFTISVCPSCPQGHTAQFQLIAFDGTFADTFEFNLDVGSYDYLVWNPDLTPGSGQTINNILTSRGYIGKYLTSLPPELPLNRFRSIFVCFGVYPNNYFINSWSSEIINLVEYINSGGRVYLEGGEVWSNDANNGALDFGPLFGLIGTEVGTNNMGPVIGQDNVFTAGMYFTYSGANNSMDHIEPTTGITIFKDQNDGFICGIANDVGTYRTVGVSFELGSLVDGIGASTKTVLLDSIMHFFEVFSAGIQEPEIENSITGPAIKVSPNPFRYNTTIFTQSPSIQIYDISGKLIKTLKSLTNNQQLSTKSSGMVLINKD